MTNNEAEARAMRDVVAFCHDNRAAFKGSSGLIIRGDSNLIIDFAKGSAKPSKPYLRNMW
jgi:hypothetical protein